MKNLIYASISLLIALSFGSCKQEIVDNDANQLLIIDQGAVSIDPNMSINYTASLVNLNGQISAASNVSWSSSNTDVATISSSGSVSISQTGISTIQASVEVGGVTLTAEVPLSVVVPGLFAVSPSAILGDINFPDIPLECIYLGTGSTSYGFQSSNTSVATVSSSGVVSFVGAGSCEITVTANGLSGNPTIIVPVLVLGTTTIDLPVTRIAINPTSYAMLKSESQQFSAKAYNKNNEEQNVTIDWEVEDPAIASVDANGTITPLAIGDTYVKASAKGISARAALTVVPSKLLIVDPYFVSKPAGQTQQFTVQQHNVSRVNGELTLGAATAASNITWEIPSFGISAFDIATIDNNGLATIKSDATPGLSTVVLAYDPNDQELEPGIAILEVPFGSGGGTGCNCGTQDAAAASINLTSSSTVNLSFGGQSQIQAAVLDATGNTLSTAAIVYCSDNTSIAEVNINGEISATGFGTGTANITVCNGNLNQTVVVNLQ